VGSKTSANRRRASSETTNIQHPERSGDNLGIEERGVTALKKATQQHASTGWYCRPAAPAI